jgi:hypothetical protein
MKLKLSKKTKSTPSHTRSPVQEKQLAKKLGGAVTPGSGNGTQKGDVRVRGVLRVECKTTKHASFSVTTEMLDKIEEAALSHGELPAMLVEFCIPGKRPREVAVVPAYVLDMITSKGGC